MPFFITDPLGARPKKRIPAELILDANDDQQVIGREVRSQSYNGASPAVISPTSIDMSWDGKNIHI